MAFEGKGFYGLIYVCVSKVVATPVSSHCLFFFSFSKSFLTSASSFCYSYQMYIYTLTTYLLATRSSSLLELSLSNLYLRKNFFSYRPLYRLSGSSKNQIKNFLSFPFLRSCILKTLFVQYSIKAISLSSPKKKKRKKIDLYR